MKNASIYYIIYNYNAHISGRKGEFYEIYCYIGEWHTHDEDLPNYSRLDLKNWKKIMKESPGNIEHFHIIVGSKAIRIWKFGKLLKDPDLIKTIYWEDVMDFDEKVCWQNNR